MFLNLKRKGFITSARKSSDILPMNLKSQLILGKLYLLPKIHKRLSYVTGRPVISSCSMPTEKASDFVDFHLKPIMQNGWSYIRDSNNFIKKINVLKNKPNNSILVTADVVGLYPSIPP